MRKPHCSDEVLARYPERRWEIGIQDLTSGKVATLQKMFGAAQVKVFDGGSVDDITPTVTRNNDTSPYNGGDAITDDTDGCSSGFGINIDGTTGLLTAGHCWKYYTTIRNARCLNGPCTSRSGSNAIMGDIIHRDDTNNGLDTEVIDTPGSQLIFTGAIGANDIANVAGATTSPVGYQVCQSGAYSGEECGLVIDNANMCISVYYGPVIGYLTKCHMVHAYSPTHGIANQGGDSGGPVFRFGGSSLYATGTVSSSTTADDVPCENFVYSGCYWDLYYENINNILSHWNATLVT